MIIIPGHREEMVAEQIENRGITNQPTLDAMKKVPRHKFVPPNLFERAYDDGPLPIGYGQTISQPYIVAYMTAAINPKPGQKDIGDRYRFRLPGCSAC